MRRVFIAVALSALMVLGTAAVAGAGEITGTGKDTPVRNFGNPDEHSPASICAFSGLNDWPWDPENIGQPDPEGFGRTQNWGQLPKELRDLVRSGNSPDPHLAAPNLACNPSGH